MTATGTVVAAYGRQYRVELADGATVLCVPRGKKSELVCGDGVRIERLDSQQGVIETLVPRKSLLYRSEPGREKLIAANVTQIVIVVATDPPFSDELITRCIVAAESQGIAVLIVLNKCDLAARLAAAAAILEPYERLGYRVLRLTARRDVRPLAEHLSHHLSLLIGQSGMGKSTLINALIPGAHAPTREVSHLLRTGRHTTTHARLYRPSAQSALIDSPGLTAFGLHHLSSAEIAEAFIELRPLLGNCRFRNCRHDREPDCCVQAALSRGEIDPRRFAAFRALCAEIN